MALWIEAESVELRPNATEDDLQAVIRAVYRQVLGNAHVLDSQRLSTEESQLRNGSISVREFVRAVALSDLYRSLCFDASSAYRFVELNFKHLLGRAPEDQAEVAKHVQIYNEQGYTAEIDSYIRSEEYISNFGDNLVPSARGSVTQADLKNVTFNRTFTLDRGYAANDIGSKAQLLKDIGKDLPTGIVERRGPDQKWFPVTAAGNTLGAATQVKANYAAITPIKWQAGNSAEDIEIIIRAVYKQVLGKDLTSSERLSSAEAQLKRGNLSVREFVRAVALSELYRSLFFETSSAYRFVELNFKHFLGRAPQDQTEIAEHVKTYHAQGYDAEINSYLNSDEYSNSFGDTVVPYACGNRTQAGIKNVTFNRTVNLMQAAASNEQGQAAQLIGDLGANLPTGMVAPTGASAASINGTGEQYRDPIAKLSAETATKFGVGLFEEASVMDSVLHREYEDTEVIIRAAYRQVFGNAYVMDSERVTVAESQFRSGNLTVREFVRALAKSDLYRTWFFTSCTRYRAIELNFRHLLGRAPLNLEEASSHSAILDAEGYDAEIDSYIDSAEYTEAFGDHVVPYIRGYKTEGCQTMTQFGHTLALVRGASGSSRKSHVAGNKACLNSLVIKSQPLPFKSLGKRVVEIPSTSVADSNPVSRLGIARFDETAPVEWVPGRSEEEAESLIQAVYRQVLGNAYVMESERLTVPESQFKRGELSVREFVRAVAKSDLYRSRFFTSCARYRAHELNFRHLLGRPPYDLEEMRYHSTLQDTEGFEADIDSYLDSDEYQDTFGENIVPYIRGYKTEACTSMVQFTHTFQLVRGASSSSLKGDLSGITPKLNSLVINQTPTKVVSPGSKGAIFKEPAGAAPARLGAGAGDKGKIYRIEVTGNRATTFSKLSRSRRANKVYMVPFNDLSKTYQKIQKQGGIIASVTAM